MTDTCWWWTGPVDEDGYGWVYTDKRLQKAHRHIYGVIVGDIPEGLTLDHLCHNADIGCPGGLACRHRRCVKPSHLEPTPAEDNWRRGYERWLDAGRRAYCKHGHAMTAENTYQPPNGPRKRVCRECARASWRRYGAKRGPRKRAS